MSRGRERSARLLGLTRVWLPVTIAVVGLVCVIIGRGRTPAAAAGVVLMGTALMVWMINWLFRMSIESNKDREQEERAREFYDEHGYWPGERGE